VLARLLSKRMLLRLLFSLGVLMAFVAGEARACAICFSGTVITPGQKLDSADQAVLAVPSADQGQFRIIAVVKGKVAAGEAIAESDMSLPMGKLAMSLDGQTAGQNVSTAPDGKPLLLVRGKAFERWTSIGTIGAEHADWLQQLAATKRSGDNQPARLWPPKVMAWSYLTDAEWRERVAVVAPYLETPEPLAAEIAYGELMRAPYGAMRTLKPQLDAARIEAWINDPKLAYRRPMYTLLLGIAGDPNDAIGLEQLIDKAVLAGDATNLSAMIAADLELRGPSRVDWLEATYFADRRRTLPEIDAALLALSVHGEADATVPRERVVEAYRYFIKVRQPMAGFVAMELANWEAWDATADYVEIIRSKAVKDPAGQFAILSYLQRSPLTAGQAALPPAAE
jgi:hypothetical protein